MTRLGETQIAFADSTCLLPAYRLSHTIAKCTVHRHTGAPSTTANLSARMTMEEPAPSCRSQLPRLRAFNLVFSDERCQEQLLCTAQPFDLPILAFVPGLDSRPLPECQVHNISKAYVVISICHHPQDQSTWEQLVTAIVPTLHYLRTRSPGGITLVGESFGAALALRIVAATPTNLFKRLVLLNPGTAILNDRVLQSATSLLPLLNVDTTGRILYKAAAIFLFKVLLTNEESLAASSLPKDSLPILHSVDIDQVPLQTMLQRVSLLKSFANTFPDECIQKLVTTPTVLIASGRDRLLKSKNEVARLSDLLPIVEKKVILPNSAHAALLEKDVNLFSILEEVNQSTNTKRVPKPRLQSNSDEEFQTAYELGKKIFGPWRRLTSPKMFGTEAVVRALHSARMDGGDQRPVLLVGNHGVFGILDLSLLFIELTELLGGARFRSMAHSTHFRQFGEFTGGRWSKFVVDLGALPASPRNFYKLLAAGENILLFPGGAREVCRRRGEENKLFWKPGVDFVRPAAKFNAIIVPFSTIGADDSVDILIDGQELQKLPYVGSIVRKLVEDSNFSPDELMPLTTFPPRPDRIYFEFHEPIDTARVDHKNVEMCQAVYTQVRSSVETGISDLFRERDADPNRQFLSRLLEVGTPANDATVSKEQTIFDKFLKSVLPTFDI